MKTKTTKITGIIITLVMLVSILGVIGAISASATDDLTVTIDTGTSVTLKDTDADGFYEIGTADELYAFAAAVNSGNTAINGELTANIVVNEGTMTEDSTDARKWTAIVDYAGIFDGAEYTVSGLYHAYFKENSGFFGSIADGGIVKNLGIVNSVFLGNEYVGSVVGNNKGTVENCYNTGIVRGYDAVGGIAGLTWNEVENCYNTGKIIGEENVGGVAGTNQGTLQNCYNRGPVSGIEIQSGRGAFVGGVVGRNLSLTANNYNTGTVSGERNVGGVVGYNGGRVENNFYLEGCATDGNDTGTVTVQNGIGDYTIGNTVADEVGKTEPEILANFASPVLANRLGDAWGQNVDNGKDSEDYPILGGDPVYYGYISCAEDATLVYTNNSIASETKLDHISEKEENKATCAHAPTCDRCGVSYGSALEHSTTAEGDRAATCASRAYCSVCESEYGTTDQTNHDETVVLVDDLCPYCNTFDTEATPVTAENYASFGLTADHVGYYAIGNTAQLYWFADKVNNENATYGSDDAVLIANITVNANVLKEDGTLNGDGSTFRVWTPIGNSSSNKYIGTFDGNGKTVSGLYFNDSSKYDVGLFGNVFNGGTVKNVGVIDSYISGKGYVGSVVGYNYGGNVINCYSKSTVCSTARDGQDIGGVVGLNYGSVINCYNEGFVNVDSYKAWRVGGVVGYNEGTVDNCYNKGTVCGKGYFLNVSNVGGVVGYNKGTVKNSHNESNIIGDEDVGGVVGCNYLTVENCYNTGDIDASISGAGGVAGYNSSGSGSNLTNCHNEGTVTGRRSGGVVAENYGTVENCYNTGDVIGNYYDIGGVAGVNGQNGKIIDSYNEGDVTCTALFDGLSGKYASDSGIRTGGVVGYNYGSVERCYNTGKIIGEGKYTGGVVGLNYGGSVQNCYNTGSVTSAGAKNGTDIAEGTGTCVGGVVGQNKNVGTVANCYNTAAVSGIDLVGGVVGENTDGSVSNNYYRSTDDINQDLGGINGTDVAGQAESKTEAIFASGEIAYLLQEGVAIPEGETVAPEVWGQTIGTNDYPVLGGDTVYLIAYCDGTPISYSNTEDTDLTHKGFNDYGYCPFCQVKITGASITAGVDLTMKYYVGLYETDLVGEGQKLAMIFTMNENTTVVYANADLVNGEYVFEFKNIAPQQMADLIDATLVVVDDNGETVETLAEKNDYSVKANAEALLAESVDKTDEKSVALVQLITDMLTYGAAAQNYRDYNNEAPENLANAGIESLSTPSEALPTESDMSLTDSTSENVRITGATVWFDNVNKIGVKLSATENVTLKVNGEIVEQTGTTYYYTDAICATDFDKLYTFELYEGDVLVQTLHYSVSSYVYSMMNRTESDGETLTEMAELARALYRYGTSAVAYKNA